MSSNSVSVQWVWYLESLHRFTLNPSPNVQRYSLFVTLLDVVDKEVVQDGYDYNSRCK